MHVVRRYARRLLQPPLAVAESLCADEAVPTGMLGKVSREMYRFIPSVSIKKQANEVCVKLCVCMCVCVCVYKIGTVLIVASRSGCIQSITHGSFHII